MSDAINVDHATLISVVADLSAMSDISQSSVATYMTSDAIFSDSVTKSFLLIQPVKEFRKWVNI